MQTGHDLLAYPFLKPLVLQGRGETTERVQEVLREAVVSSALPAGVFIDKRAVCERLGVSRFPVSEALSKLQDEGLVDILPQRGTRVARIRLADVRESLFLRRAIECENVRVLGSRGDRALLAALAANLAEQRAALETENLTAFHACDVAFHALISEAIGLPRVRSVLDGTRGALERVRRLLATSARIGETYAEHAAIVEALRAIEPERAARAMAEHLNKVLQALTLYARQRPDVFEAED